MLNKDELEQILNALKDDASVKQKEKKPKDRTSVKEVLFFGSIVVSIMLYLAIALLIIT